jgi:hypothetical protein
MHRPHRSLLLPFTMLALCACAGTPPEIELAGVERILTTLAADSMEGRRSFTPGAEKAAVFLRDEFAAIGLEPLEGESSLRQEFPVYEVSVENARVVLNGREVPSDRAAVAASGSAHLTADDNVEVLVVGETDDPRTAASALFRASTNTLVLLHPAHQQMFDRIRQYAGRSTRSIDPTAGATAAMVLTGAEQAESFEIDVTASTTEAGRIANIVGVIPGRRSEELVMFSAHYDHIGIVRPVDGDSIGNGANDDASGVAAVVELARYFKAMRKPERTLVFAAFIAEEMGGYGSRYLSTQVDPDRIVAMFNVEMIGKVSAEGPARAWITGWDESDFGAILEQADTSYTFYGDPHPELGLFNASDNATFARLGVPAHSISTTSMDGDPDYHQVSDEVETIDLEHMTATIRGIAAAAVPIISGEATPSRVDLSRMR